ncbi:uncharacterized protein LOC143907117 [Temnothorax americanus]|uniref:uncharacterized protein LOC143907117 n=1 Tax=Temnothorax americanus TaxID=1964332 RepID=UPI004068D9B9
MSSDSEQDDPLDNTIRQIHPDARRSPRDQDGDDERGKAREDRSVGGNFPETAGGSARRSYTSEASGEYEDLISVDETGNIDGAMGAAVLPTNIPTRSTLDDVLRAAGREGESTEALLIRLLTRTLLNEQARNEAPRNEVPRNEVPRNQVPLYHVIPDLSKNIENFTGDGKGIRPINWLNNIESMQKIHQWPENFALETARMHLRGGARDWYRARASTLVSWEAFKIAFKNTFVVPESTSDRWQKMIDRVQQKDESLSAYFHAKTKLCMDLKLDFRDIKEQVLDGLWSKELCISLMARNHHSLDDLLHDIMANERVLTQRATRLRSKKDQVKPKSQGQPSVTSASTSKDSKPKDTANPDKRPPVTNEEGQPKCYNCKVFGHIARDCPEEPRELLCKLCKKKGHTQRHCPDAKPTTKAEVNIIDEKNTNTISKYVKLVRLNGRQVKALIDPGSSDCTVKATLVLSEGFEVIPTRSELKGFGPAHFVVTSPGIVKAEIDVDGVIVPDILVRIVPDDTQSFDAIIGRSFTEQPYVEYRKSGDELIFSKREDSYLSVVEPSETAEEVSIVTAQTDVSVPPTSVQIIDTVSVNDHYEVAVLNMEAEQLTVRHGSSSETVERRAEAKIPSVSVR